MALVAEGSLKDTSCNAFVPTAQRRKSNTFTRPRLALSRGRMWLQGQALKQREDLLETVQALQLARHASSIQKSVDCRL